MTHYKNNFLNPIHIYKFYLYIITPHIFFCLYSKIPYNDFTSNKFNTNQIDNNTVFIDLDGESILNMLYRLKFMDQVFSQKVLSKTNQRTLQWMREKAVKQLWKLLSRMLLEEKFHSD